MQNEKNRENNRRYYEKNKEIVKQKVSKYLKEHKEQNNINATNSRKKRAERLRQQGILNPYSVINGYPPKYGIKVNND